MKKAPLLVALGYVLWGILPIFWKLLADVDSIYVLCCRIFFSLIVSYIVVLLNGRAKEALALLRDRKCALRMLACGLTISLTGAALSTAWRQTASST